MKLTGPLYQKVMNISKIKRVLKHPNKKFYWPTDVLPFLMISGFCMYTCKKIYDYNTQEKWDSYYDYYQYTRKMG